MGRQPDHKFRAAHTLCVFWLCSQHNTSPRHYFFQGKKFNSKTKFFLGKIWLFFFKVSQGFFLRAFGATVFFFFFCPENLNWGLWLFNFFWLFLCVKWPINVLWRKITFCFPDFFHLWYLKIERVQKLGVFRVLKFGVLALILTKIRAFFKKKKRGGEF